MTTAPDDARRRRRHRNERIAAGVVVLLLLLATASIALWKKWLDSELDRDRRYIPRDVEITAEMELLQEYVRIDTSTPEGVMRGAQWLVAELRKRGIQPEIIESAPGRPNVYARIRGRSRGEGLLLFNHIDVVPPGPGWTAAPFAGGIGGGRLFGRGTLDMKALALCQLFAFADIAASDAPPDHDLVFLATADEESGSEYGMKWIVANRPDVLEGIRYGLTEGGVTEMMSERMTYFGIEVGGKQVVELDLVGADREALEQARIALEPSMFSREPERVTEPVRRYFRSIAPTRKGFGPLLADIDRTIRDGSFWRLPPPYRDLTQNSLHVGSPEQRGEAWVMPARQINLPDESPDTTLAKLAAAVAPYGVTIGTVRQRQGPVPVSTDETELFALLSAEARQRYDVTAGTQILYGSTSDSRFLRPLGIICYGVSPYPVDYFESTTIHGRNERIRLDGFLEGVAYMRNVVRAWASRDH